MIKGQKVFVLREYSLYPGTISSTLRANSKTVSVLVEGYSHPISVPVDKVVDENTSICIVWEQWKGKNGRGGYRLEKNLYPNVRLPAIKYFANHGPWSRSMRYVYESVFGKAEQGTDITLFLPAPKF